MDTLWQGTDMLQHVNEGLDHGVGFDVLGTLRYG